MRLILIGGAQRSGTTLLQTLLANALRSPIVPEDHVLCDMVTAYKRAKEVWHKTSFFYPTQQDLFAFFKSVVQRHIEGLRPAVNGDALVLKDPNFAQIYPELSELFPHATLIACLRDPRDIAASFVQIGQRQPRKGTLDRYQRRDMRSISRKIATSYAPLTQDHLKQAVKHVRYEQVARSPAGALEALGREANLDLALDQLENPAWLPATARHDPAWVSPLEGGQPSAESIGIFRKVLRRDEIAAVEQICGSVFDCFGYQRSVPRAQAKVLAAANSIRSDFRHLIRGILRPG